MKNDNEKVNIILKKLVPELASRMAVLERIKKYWASIVGSSLAKYSVPYDLKNNTLYIAVKTQHAAHILNSMKGNIKRSEKSISDLKITNGIPLEYFNKNQKVFLKKSNEIKISDDEVNTLAKNFPKNLSQETANALAHLIIFFNKRFPEKEKK